MAKFDLVCLIAGLVLFILAASGFVGEPPRTRLIAAGLACWIVTLIF